MIQMALFGAGRIGKMHAEIMVKHPQVSLRYIYDQALQVAQEVAQKHSTSGAVVKVADIESILADDSIDAVLIASPTNTHVDLIHQSAQAGKAILCEKPIDLDIAKVDKCQRIIADTKVPIQIGFNRRYDPGHSELCQAVHQGDIGKLEAVVITSRDPAPPPVEYIQVSGGLFRDMMIHDFDLVRAILREEPHEIMATGSVQVNKTIGELGDVDSAMVTLKTPSGTLCHINCSRRAVYGYDQRVEAFGNKGMLISNNPVVTQLARYTQHHSEIKSPLHSFFIERYSQAYTRQLDAFIAALINHTDPYPSFADGRHALLLANAAQQSLDTAKMVKLPSL